MSTTDTSTTRLFLGADILAYYNEWPLGEDWYRDSDEGDIHDMTELVPDRMYDGSRLGVAVRNVPTFDDDDVYELADLIEEWLRSREGANHLVWVPRDKRDAFMAALAQCGLTLGGT